ncbi:DUF559 domain-containing protein [Saccharopolyspora sp. TS4A08]|uniref:DUF559 domain-containing protein n=1 Tax=Saccharopolyspora ipomoeae TaxID=3042027 RepID=A0ABT6PPS9_9PSEU|nr:DUF559 domain-containing protein [Saccharopolyspora sp. TS4A08]MDI2030016.1 DUF559 domain-containing protein [Saccharopolyspora sp. TS4A08]
MVASNKVALGGTRGLFTRKEALQQGFSDKDLRNGPYRRIFHGVYLLESVPLTHELLCRGAAMVLPPDAVITGRSAASLHGIDLARPTDPVEVLTRNHKRVQGLRVWDTRRHHWEHFPWGGVRLATLVRAAFDLLTKNPLTQGVACVDALLHSGMLSKDALGRFMNGRHDNGIRRARHGFELLDERAESVPESVLRVKFALRGLRPVPQLEIPGEFGQQLRGDLGFPEAKVVVEYEGRWHADPEQFRRDERRRAWLRANGWLVIVVTAEDLATSADQLVETVARAVRERTPR